MSARRSRLRLIRRLFLFHWLERNYNLYLIRMIGVGG